MCMCVCGLSFTLSCAPELLLTGTSASLSVTDKDGNTALHLACSSVSVHTETSSPILFIVANDSSVLKGENYLMRLIYTTCT